MPLNRVFSPQKLEGFRSYLLEFASSFGITDMIFPEHMPNTRRVIAAAEFARDQGKLHEFRQAAMNAYWRTGKNLEEPEVIAEVGKQVGLSSDEAVAAMQSETYLQRALAMRREAEDAGITGIPTFFIGAQRIYGCQPYEVLADAVERCSDNTIQ